MPSFLARIALFLSSYAPLFLIVGGVSLLVLLQPDLGTMTVIAATAFLLLFLAGVRLRLLAITLFLSADDDATVVRDIRQALQQVQGVTDVRVEVKDASQSAKPANRPQEAT